MRIKSYRQAKRPFSLILWQRYKINPNIIIL